jgi:hypothetical protein
MSTHVPVRQGSFSLPIARKLSDNLRPWTDDWEAFVGRHRCHSAIAVGPLYALPSDLIDSLEINLPGWLSPAEMAFEHDLCELCEQYHAVGVFHRRLVHDLTLHRPAPLILSEALFRKLGWDRYWTLARARHLMRIGLQRIDPLLERLDAYRGWLLTSPLFQRELQQLKARWENAVAQVGHIPAYPLQSPDGCIRRPRKGRDVTETFVNDFNGFYDRWQLERLATWDLPIPRGANLTGTPLPASVASASTMIALQMSPILPLPGNYSLLAILAEIQRARSPSHLQSWLQVQQQEHAGDLRFGRFRRIFLLHFYRDTVLASRYGKRFAGHIEALDRAFGDYFGDLGVDSIKKLRLQMDALRRRDP